MKKTIVFALLFITAIALFSCNNRADKKMSRDAGITFSDTLIEFGQMKFDSKGEREFIFTNTGKAPLLLTHVKSTCGCTVPEWSNEPVKPSDKGRILVSYDTHRIGRFRKSIYVYSNAIEGTRRLYISGEVLQREKLNDYRR